MKKSNWSKLVWNKAFYDNFCYRKSEFSIHHFHFPKLNALSEVQSHESPSDWSELSLTCVKHTTLNTNQEACLYYLTWHYFNRPLLHPLSTQNFKFQLKFGETYWRKNCRGEIKSKKKKAYFTLACITFSITKPLLSPVPNLDKLIGLAKTSHIRSLKRAVDFSFDGVFCSEKIWVQALSGKRLRKALSSC